MTTIKYVDANSVPHVGHDDPLSELWRKLMKHHMDACYAAKLHPITAASLLINGAGYILGAACSEAPELRAEYTEQLVAVFRGKVEQAVHEGRADRQCT